MESIPHLQWLFLVLLLFIASNLYIVSVPAKVFNTSKLGSILLLSDAILISLGIYFSKGFNSDLYLVYFLVIFISVFMQELKISIIIGIVASLTYFTGILVQPGDKADILTQQLLLRVPFLFLISVIGFYITEQLRIERKRMDTKLSSMEKALYLGESVTGIINQLKEPLTAITAQCQHILAIDDVNAMKDKIKDTIDKLRNMLTFIDKYISFVSNQQPGFNKTNVNLIINNILDLTENQFKINNITIIRELQEDLPEIHGDTELLKQVFLHLINNARQSIMKTNEPGRLSIKSEKINDHVRLTFTDTGTGIDKTQLKYCFKSVFVTSECEGGMGVGLKIVGDIIEKHNGEIQVDSKGRGATFTIELPIDRP
jgi:signal transduction histidine kinase